MPQPIAYLNGRFVPLADVHVALTDVGFMQGVTVSEQLRTFGGKLFRLDEHLARLRRSLEIIELDLGVQFGQLAAIAREIAEHNFPLLPAGDDLGLAIFATPGTNQGATPSGVASPTVCVHSRPLPFAQWAGKYRRGEAVAVSSVRQIPQTCWPAELKCRSRMHYYLADRDAQRRFPGSRAILLHEDETVSEATTANVLVVFEDGAVVSPPRERILPGISVAVVRELCASLGIAFVEREMRRVELMDAREILLTSTSPCVLGVSQIDGRAVGGETSGGVTNSDVMRSGTICGRLLAAWSESVGIDIVAQAERGRS
jgi:branched-subunit amino acid aminotransferase/4-amino-4-deoxychorismate lyase